LGIFIWCLTYEFAPPDLPLKKRLKQKTFLTLLLDGYFPLKQSVHYSMHCEA